MESQWLEIVSWAALALGVTGTYGIEMVADAHARARGRLTRLESRRDRFFERRGVVLFRIATSSTDWPPTSCRMRSGTTSPAAGSRSQLMPGRDALFSLSPTRACRFPRTMCSVSSDPFSD